MNKKMFIYILSALVISMVITGCGNTGTSSVKASQFGKTQKDTSLLTEVAAKFGELGKSATPRILNPIVTTGIVEFLPVDVVQAYSKDTKNFYVWFIYDSFNNGDTGTITWKYLDTNEIVATDNIVLSTTSEMKYGRYAGNIIGPDGGWPTGKYAAVISIKGVEATVNFEVVDGKTISQGFTLGENTVPTKDDTNTKTTPPANTASTYSDPNYPFKVDAYDDYKHTVQSGNIVFKSPTREMYYIVEVISSTSSGGTLSSKKEVASDYYTRFSAYSPTFPGEGKKTVDGKEALDTSVKYTADGVKYTNRFIIGDGQDYFYVLQFVTPDSEVSKDQAIIERVISSFKFTVRGTRSTTTQTDTTTTPPTVTTPPEVTTPPAASALEVAQKCYDDNYKAKIADAYTNNNAAGTWDSYFNPIGADSDCSAQLKTCNEAIDASHAYDDSTFGDPDVDRNTWPMNVLRVKQMRVCYNRAVACNDLAYKKTCKLPNPTLQVIANVPESFCNERYTEMLKGFRDQIPGVKANPDAGDALVISAIDNCYQSYKTCTISANSVRSTCDAAVTDGNYDACKTQFGTSMADCASTEFDCAGAKYKTICHTMATQ